MGAMHHYSGKIKIQTDKQRLPSLPPTAGLTSGEYTIALKVGVWAKGCYPCLSLNTRKNCLSGGSIAYEYEYEYSCF